MIWCGGRGALNQHLFKVTSKEYPRWFVFRWILEHLSGFRGIAAGKATTMGHIQRHHLTDAKVVIPSGRVLDAADRLIAPLLAKSVTNELESRTLAELRDTLLPKLLSGEVRVRDAERVVEAVG
jgi:type I restriction enzyme S subunit